jgi:hypothetical protein
MDLTIGQVADLLERDGLPRPAFDRRSIKPFSELEEEDGRGEVRFILRNGKDIVALRRRAVVLARTDSYQYLEVERLHLKKGVWMSNKNLRGHVKPYTLSETMRWSPPDEGPDRSEDAVRSAIYGAFEECGVKIRASDLTLVTFDNKLPAPRPSSVYAGILSCSLDHQFEIRPYKLGLREKRTELFDNFLRKDVKSVIRRLPIPPEGCWKDVG